MPKMIRCDMCSNELVEPLIRRAWHGCILMKKDKYSDPSKDKEFWVCRKCSRDVIRFIRGD